ncbi:nucleotidyltransferase family protein [Thermaerobacillus caldiproteolyticus]|uniref:nucleotidyltransferase family protein n=1 Tax=Thermaerobacillus caldiproteolyticus TaxID=247480 RepID=UPI00188CE00B|nr:nucleotidyltransferase family protein [Anoxybacillus caldiproteolyticus]QPA31435.1 nucleotidyltransferase family protein [Anoxybacillus caldiproteolyticus]
MMIKNEKDIIQLIKEDEWMMNILRAVKSLNLPDWWVCAGFVRSKIWDTLHGFKERTPIPDIDVIYFDDTNMDELEEKKFEIRLRNILPNIPWSVKNEARMHIVNNIPPYSSSVDAISKFPETATSLGVKLDEMNDIILVAPWGVDDVINLEVKPTPYFQESKERAQIYEERIIKKNWKDIWYKVNVFHIDTSY